MFTHRSKWLFFGFSMQESLYPEHQLTNGSQVLTGRLRVTSSAPIYIILSLKHHHVYRMYLRLMLTHRHQDSMVLHFPRQSLISLQSYHPLRQYSAHTLKSLFFPLLSRYRNGLQPIDVTTDSFLS